MSSPFHSLRKNKVPLFPGHMIGNRPIPFRHPDLSEDESKLLEEITSGMVKERRKQDELLPLPRNLPAHQNDKQSDSSVHQSVPSMLRRFGPPGSCGAAAEKTTLPYEESNETGGVPSPPPTDKELMRMMMNKIAILEQQNQTQQDELKAKDRRLKMMEDRLRIAEKARAQSGGSRAMDELETHCLLLQQQVHEMETFLAEYGMVWVGDTTTNDSEFYIDEKLYDGDSDESDMSRSETGGDNPAMIKPGGVWRQETSLGEGDTSLTLNIDFDLLMENIRDLNVLAGAGQAQIKKTSDGARFEVPEPVQLSIYANGLLMFDGPFRSFSEPTARQCVQDLLDGYFPSELQRRYPDGVPFVVTDLRGTFYQVKHNPPAFAGEGQTLGGDIGPSRLIPTRVVDQSKKIPLPSIGGPAMYTQTDTVAEASSTSSHHPRKPLTQEQFINKLPKSVIKNGKVIDIRNSVNNSLTGNTPLSQQSKVTVVNTSVTKEMSESFKDDCAVDSKSPSQSQKTAQRPKSYKGHGDVTTLRVIADQGGHTYIVKMKFSETIGDLRTYLDRQKRPTVPYDIVSTFPHRVHDNNKLTLKESGLTPNAVLHVKPVKP